jgi:hypothetical protein
MPSTHRYLCEDEKADVKECMLSEKRVNRSGLYPTNLHIILFFHYRSFVIIICTNIGKYLHVLYSFNVIKINFSFYSVKKNLPFPEDPIVDGYNWPSFKYLN